MAEVNISTRFGRLFGRFPKAIAFAIGLCSMLWIATPARAENFFENYYPNFFSLQQPGRLDVVGFGGGFISDQYGTLQEGVQAEQTITPYIGAFGRVTGYQLFLGHGFGSPLNPNPKAKAHSRLNFVRFQGGLDFTLAQGTHLYISGGHDAADSDAPIIEGDFSTWLWLRSRHPINFSFSTIYNWQNHVESSSIDFQTIAYSSEKWMFLAGAGGAYYVGGFLANPAGQGGPDLGFFYRPWAIGATTQFGYGTSRQYGQISFYKSLSFRE